MAKNLLSDNQASVETDTTGFNVLAGATLTRDTSEKLHGPASLKVVTPNAAVNEGVFLTSVAVSASQTYTASAWFKGSGTIILRLHERDSGDLFVDDTNSSIITLSATWTRYSLSNAFGATGVKVRLVAWTNVQQGISFYIDKLQIEQASTVTIWRLPSAWGRRNAARDFVVRL